MRTAHPVPWAALAAVTIVANGSAFAQREEKALDSRIDRVTIYPANAMVTRAAMVDLTPGSQVLVFERLPLSTGEDALSCHIEGGARVAGIKLERREYGAPVAERLIALERDLAQIESLIDDLAAEVSVLDEKREFLTAVRTESPKALAQSAAAAPSASPVASLRGTLGFIAAERALIEREHLRLRRRQEELQDRHGRIQSELGNLQDPRTRDQLMAARVEVEAPAGGRARIELHYLVSGAAWRPLYDARLDRAARTVEWSSYASIMQRSGEDWTEVEITVSTADPTRPAAPPVLDAIYLAAGELPPRPEMEPVLARAEQRGIEEVVSKETVGQAKETVIDVQRADTHHSTLRGGRGSTPALVPYVDLESARTGAMSRNVPVGALPVARLGETGAGTLYRIARRESIPSDASWHRALINACAVPVDLVILTVPRTACAAYIEARGPNVTGAALLPGTIHLYRAGDFVGTTNLDRAVVPGGSLALGFGTLDRIEVKQELVSEMRSQTRAMTELDYHYRTVVRNYEAAAQKLRVLDQVPVSMDERVEVTVRSVLPRAIAERPDERGVLTWEVEVPAGGEARIELEYRVRVPRDWRLVGS